MSVVHIVIVEIIGYISISQECTIQQMHRTVSADVSPGEDSSRLLGFISYYISAVHCRLSLERYSEISIQNVEYIRVWEAVTTWCLDWLQRTKTRHISDVWSVKRKAQRARSVMYCTETHGTVCDQVRCMCVCAHVLCERRHWWWWATLRHDFNSSGGGGGDCHVCTLAQHASVTTSRNNQLICLHCHFIQTLQVTLERLLQTTVKYDVKHVHVHRA